MHKYKVISVDAVAGTWVLELDGKVRLNFPIPVADDGSILKGQELDWAVVEMAAPAFSDLRKANKTDFTPLQGLVDVEHDITEIVQEQAIDPASPFSETNVTEIKP